MVGAPAPRRVVVEIEAGGHPRAVVAPLAGRPFNALTSNPNNRIAVRNYFTEGDVGTYRVGDWRSLPAKFNFGGRSYDLVFANDAAGANNSGMTQGMKSLLGVLQSY